MTQVGPSLRRILSAYLDGRPLVEMTIMNSVSDKVVLELPAEVIAEVRNLLGRALKVNLLAEPEARGGSPIVPALLHGVATALGDPADDVSHWFHQGAPAGITIFPSLDRTFARTDGSHISHPLDPHSLQSDLNTFGNQAAFENDSEAKDTVRNYIRAGFLKSYPSMAAAEMSLGRAPVLSRFAVLSKERDGIIKKRLILDAKRSD
eukprot:4798002-Amphidinium_carterae.1